MQVDEVRKKENLESFSLDFIKLGLQDVLYYPETGEIYTPNTGMSNYTSKEGSGIPVTPSDTNCGEGKKPKLPRQVNEPTANMKKKAEKAGGVALGMVTKGGENNEG